jgi:hypothetical protein
MHYYPFPSVFRGYHHNVHEASAVVVQNEDDNENDSAVLMVTHPQQDNATSSTVPNKTVPQEREQPPPVQETCQDDDTIGNSDNNNSSASRSVRFAATSALHTYHAAQHVLTDLQCMDLWYQNCDYQFFRQQRDSIVRRERQQQQQQQTTVRTTVPSSTTVSYATSLEAMYDDCCRQACQPAPAHWSSPSTDYNSKGSASPPQDEEEHCFSWLLPSNQSSRRSKDPWKSFADWIQRTALERLGLERSIVLSLAQDRRYRRTELLETVMELQDCGHDLLAHDKEQLIAEACQLISRPSRMFATQLAWAHYHDHNNESRHPTFFSSYSSQVLQPPPPAAAATVPQEQR